MVIRRGELRGIEFCNKEKIYIVLGVKKRELNRKNDGQNIISVYFKKLREDLVEYIIKVTLGQNIRENSSL